MVKGLEALNKVIENKSVESVVKNTMSEIVNQSLQKIAKGTGIIFIGTIIGMLSGFIGRVRQENVDIKERLIA